MTREICRASCWERCRRHLRAGTAGYLFWPSACYRQPQEGKGQGCRNATWELRLCSGHRICSSLRVPWRVQTGSLLKQCLSKTDHPGARISRLGSELTWRSHFLAPPHSLPPAWESLSLAAASHNCEACLIRRRKTFVKRRGLLLCTQAVAGFSRDPACRPALGLSSAHPSQLSTPSHEPLCLSVYSIH